MRLSVSGVLIAALGLVGCTNDDGSEGASPAKSTTSTAAATSSTTTPTTENAEAGCVPPPEPEPRSPELDAIVKVFLFCNGGMFPVDLHPVGRAVPNDGAPVRAALNQLLLGVTPAEASAGMQSAFSEYTAGTLRGVTTKSGVATLDFTAGFESTNNFSTTNLSAVVLSQLEATIFQFPEITAIEFEIEGKRWCGWEADCSPGPLSKR